MGDCVTLGSGDTDLPWHITVTETKALADREQTSIHGEFVLEGTVELKGSAQLVIEN